MRPITRQDDQQLDLIGACTCYEGRPGVLGAQIEPVAKNNSQCCLEKSLDCIHKLEYSGCELYEGGNEPRELSKGHHLRVFPDLDEPWG